MVRWGHWEWTIVVTRSHRRPPSPPPITRAQLVGSSASTGAAGEPSAVPGRAGARVLRVGGAARMVRGGMELSSPLDLGIIDDWEAVEALWAHGLEQLRVGERCPHPLLVAAWVSTLTPS